MTLTSRPSSSRKRWDGRGADPPVGRGLHLATVRKVHPQLEAGEQPIGALGHLLVHDPAARAHPLDVPGVDDALVAEGILVLGLPAEHVGDRLEAPVGMPGEPRHVVGRVHRAEVVEQEERIEVAVPRSSRTSDGAGPQPPPSSRHRRTSAGRAVASSPMLGRSGRGTRPRVLIRCVRSRSAPASLGAPTRAVERSGVDATEVRLSGRGASAPTAPPDPVLPDGQHGRREVHLDDERLEQDRDPDPETDAGQQPERARQAEEQERSPEDDRGGRDDAAVRARRRRWIAVTGLPPLVRSSRSR